MQSSLSQGRLSLDELTRCCYWLLTGVVVAGLGGRRGLPVAVAVEGLVGLRGAAGRGPRAVAQGQRLVAATVAAPGGAPGRVPLLQATRARRRAAPSSRSAASCGRPRLVGRHAEARHRLH